MIQIIAGEKGKGKTKILIEKVNTEVKTAKGDIVYIDKNIKHMYELSNKIRLINIRDFFIQNQSEFIGFLCGIISCDHDIQSIYLDSFLNISYVENENLEHVFHTLEKISNKFHVDFVLSISLNLSSEISNVEQFS